MHIEQLQARHIRNLTNAVLEPSPGLNILFGRNASGKTSLLESIYFLARARSFRTTHIKEVIQHQKKALQITARIRVNKIGALITGVEKSKEKLSIRYNGQAVKTVSEQAKQFPLVSITPDSHQLVTGSPKLRRHWLDWAMFHVEPSYLQWWRNYHKSLRQRNNLLRRGLVSESSGISVWERKLSGEAENIQRARLNFIKQLEPTLITALSIDFMGKPRLELRCGWPENEALGEALERSRMMDSQAGHTRFGIHKADLGLWLNDCEVSKACSRGQIKMFVSALLIAQAKVFEREKNEKPVFLVDDFAAEIDTHACDYLFKLLQQQTAQVFLTTTETDPVKRLLEKAALFHVEHGNVTEVVK